MLPLRESLGMKRWLCAQPARILVPTELVEPVSVSVTARQFLSKILVLPSPLDAQGLGESGTFWALRKLSVAMETDRQN